MTQLSKTDEKYLSMVEPHLGDIQAFVDLHIQGSSTLTAAAIHQGFTAETDCDLSGDDFIKGFRIAVRIDKITGIESAKRAGYRRIGAAKGQSAADAALESIVPYLDDLQSFVDLHIQGSTRMTAAVIYQKFSAENKCELSEDDFVKAFRLALRENKIVGLESAYRFGYKRAGAKPEVSDDSASAGDDKAGNNGRGEVVIDERRRLVALDKYNWAYQTRKDSGRWNNESYYSNAFQALRGLARKLMDDELKQMESFPVEQLEQKFSEAESNLMALLHKAIGRDDGRDEKPSASS
jgi:hypothetical protein